MDDKFWLDRWCENKIGFHQQEFNAHLTKFWEKLDLNPQGIVFVPMCGKSRDLLWLNDRGHPVMGIELSEIAVKTFFSENGLQYKQHYDGRFSVWCSGTIKLFCGDFFSLKLVHLCTEQFTVQAVYDRASLIALPADMRVRYVQHFKSLFEKGIKVLLVTLEYPESEMQGPPFSVPESEVLDLYSGSFDIKKVYEKNILDFEENARFKDQGMTSLVEKVYLLTSLP